MILTRSRTVVIFYWPTEEPQLTPNLRQARFHLDISQMPALVPPLPCTKEPSRMIIEDQKCR